MPVQRLLAELAQCWHCLRRNFNAIDFNSCRLTSQPLLPHSTRMGAAGGANPAFGGVFNTTSWRCRYQDWTAAIPSLEPSHLHRDRKRSRQLLDPLTSSFMILAPHGRKKSTLVLALLSVTVETYSGSLLYGTAAQPTQRSAAGPFAYLNGTPGVTFGQPIPEPSSSAPLRCCWPCALDSPQAIVTTNNLGSFLTNWLPVLGSGSLFDVTDPSFGQDPSCRIFGPSRFIDRSRVKAPT